MKLEQTNRGFALVKFKDRNGVECSLQKSSIATEDCIWLGCNDANPQTLIPGIGWQPVQMPREYIANTRMHLTRDQVSQLLPYLQEFILSGEIGKSELKQLEVEACLDKKLPFQAAKEIISKENSSIVNTLEEFGWRFLKSFTEETGEKVEFYTPEGEEVKGVGRYDTPVPNFAINDDCCWWYEAETEPSNSGEGAESLRTFLQERKERMERG